MLYGRYNYAFAELHTAITMHPHVGQYSPKVNWQNKPTLSQSNI